jgi:hypothetical protein
MTDYKKAVENLAQNKSDFIFSNSSPEHASIVLSTMIKHSEREFRIYDDNLSGDVANLNEEFYSNLENFVKSEKILKIVIDSDEHRESRIFQDLLSYKKLFPNNIQISIASESFKNTIRSVFNKTVNFAIGDSSSFRIEDIMQSEVGRRKAICCFNNTKITKQLVNSFDIEFPSCQSI